MRAITSYGRTRLDHSALDFQVDGIPAGKMPLAVNDLGVVVVVQAYILECCVRAGDHWRTAEKHGYTLCEWYDFLQRLGLSIFDAHEGHLRNFLLGGGKRTGNVVAVGKTVQVPRTKTNLAKFKAVIAFYDFWQNKRGKILKSFRGTTIADIPENLFEREGRSAAKAELNFTKASQTNKSKRRVGTPDDDDWDAVIDEVLSRQDENRAQTYYLIGNLARRSGSRGLGIHGLMVTEFLKGISSEKLFKKTPNYRSVIKHYLLSENRVTIIAFLQLLGRSRRKFIYCEVPNKGGGDPVPIAIPVELAIEIFEYICTRRQDIVRMRFLKANKKPPDNVFLSYKTTQAGGALTQEAMGNFFNKLFRQLEIDGTFHRLRAAFCQEVVRDIYVRERAINGKAWRIENVLELARKLLGHKNPHSLEHYLNAVLAEEALFGDPIMVETPEDTPYVRALAAKLCAPDNDNFREALRGFMQEQGVEPIFEEGRRYAVI
ncbi:hypothetical protein FHX06_003390 [Rhizobium sp. BK512]|uniref:site-specific integrase n=1 Tax=Rhizobium sp. BK512 TaxID=2587010 RepID=UPI00160ABEF7|nr:site-specific integrase [Rhizobium sp. BK512]MBB3562059.1 hypothetical protein [Rhizobium sp. BK512]